MYNNEYKFRIVNLSKPFVIGATGKTKPFCYVEYAFDTHYATRLMDASQGGGGIFLERHPFKQIIIPKNSHSSGHMLFARRQSPTVFNVISVQIPFGYAIIVEPNA